MSDTLNLLDQLQIAYGKHQIVYGKNQEPIDFTFLEVNETYLKYFSVRRETIIQKTAFEAIPSLKSDNFDWLSYYSEIAENKKKHQMMNYSKVLKQYYTIYTIGEGNGVFITLYVQDKNNFSMKSVSKNESISRIELLNDMLKKPQDTIESVLNQYMNASIELTNSQIGYIYFYDEETKLFTLNNWSNGVMDVCSVTEPKTTYELEKTGIWGEVVRQRKAIIVNDYASSNPLKKGTPEGHAPLIRWMSLPIWDNNKIVGVLGLANKPTEYDEFDLHEVDILMKNVWTLINLMKASEDLKVTEALLRASMESQEIVLLIDTNYTYLFYNENHRKNMELLYHSSIQIGQNIFDGFTVESDILKEKSRYDRAFKGESFIEVDTYGENGEFVFETKYTPIIVNDEIIGASIFTSNITERMKEIERVKDSEEKFRLIYSTMSQGLAIHEVITDEKGNPTDYRCLEVNDSYLKLFGYKREDIVGKRIKTVAPLLEDYWVSVLGTVALTGEPRYYENYSKTIDKYLSVYAYSPKPNQFAILISDITSRVKHEKEIKYLSYNDQLTGLYNRRYYEETLLKLDQPLYYPLSIIVGDVNGLKLVNDSFGHQKGDQLLKKVADILVQSCRNTDIITRIGGDEFVILLPNTNESQVVSVVERIRSTAAKETLESIEVSISFGYDTKTEASDSINALFKSAEDDMYRNKIVDTRSMRSKTVDLIINTLFEKNEREMFHSKRVSGYCEAMGKELHFDNRQINLLKNAGLMHDIGKIGITDSILNKQTTLLKEEFLEIQKHSEIGYRILNSIPEFSEIAKFILEHHEKYDGSGYPNALKGEDISLQARIICVCDAYDAMTGPRPYKSPISKEEAIKELKRCSGTMFDPEVVDIFIQKVLL